VFIYWYNHVLAFNAETGVMRWSRSFGITSDGINVSLVSRPILDGGMLYVSATTETATFYTMTLYVIAPVSGVIVTTYGGLHGLQGVSNSILYESSMTTIYARQLPGDTPLWHRQILPNQSNVPAGAHAGIGNVLVTDGVAYVPACMVELGPSFPYDKCNLYMLDAGSGMVIWQSPPIKAAFNPVVVTNDTVYVPTFPSLPSATPAADMKLYAFDAHSHTLLWQKQIGRAFNLVPGAKIVYVASFVPGNEPDPGAYTNLMALRASDGLILWQIHVNWAPSSSGVPLGAPLGIDGSGILYTTGGSYLTGVNTAVLYAINPSSGAVLWHMADGASNTPPWAITIV
jgi:outer membrane protein assembly factor BamB